MPVDRNPADLPQIQKAQFATTHWSLVLTASDHALPGARDAMEQLCRTYWFPLYAFVRREGYDSHQAQDLTQDFFALLLERHDLARASPEKGRLRSYLLVSLRHFLLNQRKRAQAQKRGADQVFVPLDVTLAEERLKLEPADARSPDLLYERRWAMTVLNQPFEELRAEYVASENVPLFDWLRRLLADDDSISLRDVAVELGMTENAVKQACFRFRQRYRALLRSQIAQTVGSLDQIDDEIRCLIQVLRQ